ncbi:PIN domain-containing protein [Methylocapsa sp. S129]|uniref:PIN domain-containing protein n=1 Tax=Methylocapsa sp. S129 TaxID=1641869 RepID=UPI00131D5A9B|nr:type II toxin-antitoxin system VapC family toxin [Methylocapsa sp. S129]
MIGLDTNVLVRYFTQDDPVQSPKATRFIEWSLTPENPGFISIVTMVEMVWVLERTYRLDRESVGAAIERILQADAFVVEQEREVFIASVAFASGLGFADALIEALGAKSGCSHTVTFDQKALRMPGFEPV